jgi:hypothetical protein
MLKTLARMILALAVIIPNVAFATAKQRETIELQVVSSQTKTHGSPPGEVFHYTDAMFTQVNGKNVIYECVRRADLCPLMESGKAYTADRDGGFIYIAIRLANGKPIVVKYKQLGSW